MEILSAKKILAANDKLARDNRRRLDEQRVFMVNLIGSPGAGKTTLLERLLPEMGCAGSLRVVQGDMATREDADRIEAVGVKALQINTENGCHLAAHMLPPAFEMLDLPGADFLFVENVGNLICPAEFHLGEHLRAIVLSVPEGDDKVRKYPPTFATADALVVTKTDLAASNDFDFERVASDLKRLSPRAKVFKVCAKRGEGIRELAEWLKERRESAFA
ncbi:MAG: hydrogenase accessory protein HypB [Planctomycetota bacterium]|nr:MAG: hydrogenase accessory protein HypB [Planctomycetota bacterium]